MKVYNTTPVYLPIKSFDHKDPAFFDDWSIHLFQSNQRFQVIKLVDPPVPEKVDIFRINLSTAFFTKNASLSEKRFLLSVK